MSWFPVAEMTIALGVFGFLYWLLDGVVVELLFVSVTGSTLTFLNFVWDALPFIVLFMSGVYLLHLMQKRQYVGGGV